MGQRDMTLLLLCLENLLSPVMHELVGPDRLSHNPSSEKVDLPITALSSLRVGALVRFGFFSEDPDSGVTCHQRHRL
jgi:hypothetical protein